MEKSLAEIATIEIAKLLMPLKKLNSPQRITGFVKKLGWSFPAGEELDVKLTALVGLVEDLATTISNLIDAQTDEQTLEELKKLAEKSPNIITTVHTVAPQIEAAIKAIPGFVGESADLAKVLPRRFLDYLLYRYLQTYYRKIFAVLHVLGIIETVNDRQDMPIKTVQWQRLPLLFSEPLHIANQVYKWNDENEEFNGSEFLRRFEVLLRAFSLSGGIYRQGDDIRAQFGRTEAGDDKEIRMPLFQTGIWPDSWMELDLNLSPIPPEGNKKSGLALYPYLTTGLNIKDEIADNWVLEKSGDADLDAGFGVKVRAPHNLELMTGLFSVDAAEYIDARLEVSLKRTSPADSLSYIFGTKDTSHLALKEVRLKFCVALQDGDEEFVTELDIKELTIAINPGKDGDGFLQKILSGINVKSTRDLGIGISNKDGFYFRGSSALSITLPTRINLGPVSIESTTIGVGLEERSIKLILGASFSAELGPVSVSVKRMGVTIPASFPEDGKGNLGPVQIESPEFLPPTGVDLSIDASGIVGGGVLDFDDANKRYTGDITLNFGEIGLTAIGLITTKMPDGSEGFALLVNIGATFNPPMQLSMGFNLSGVGGLIGVNRSMEIDVLRTGLKNRTLDSILFPDPSTVIANASKIISDLRTVFPPAEERYVVGPMVKIGWGSPTIITADLGIFLEFPDPVRIVLLGQVEAALPEEKKALVVIHLDVLGVLEFAKEELTFQASLYDSRILSFALFGDSAFLLGWGCDPRFALSLGGFHPKFTPPPPPIVFADLKRLTLDIGTGSKLQLACRAYLALTPNSLQFGARVDLYASAGGLTAEGHLGFDALFYLSPFSFEVEIRGGVHLKYKGLSLCGINLTLLLSGPTPWHARGKAKISLLFFSIEVGFSITWGQREKVTLQPIDAWQPLQKALAAAGNWSSGLPAGRTLVESLRGFEEEAPGMIIVHPAGRLEVRQNVVPLGIGLDKAGNAPITGHDLFDIEDLIVDDKSLNPEPVQEFFARGQFEELTSDQKLSVPSFERMKGGVTTAASEMVQIDGGDDVVEYKPVTYESILIKRDSTSELQQLDGEFEWEEAQFIVAAGITRKAIRRAGPRKRFSSLHPRPKVGVHEDAYCIANAEDLTRATLSSELDHENRHMTRMAADQALRAQIELEPKKADNLLVVPEYEVYKVIA